MHRTSLATATVLGRAAAGAVLPGSAPRTQAADGVPSNRGWDSVTNRGWSQDARDASDLVDH